QGYYAVKPHRSVTCDLVGDGLTLGCQTYSCDEVIDILNAQVAGNGALILAQQLIAAKLNVLRGASDTGTCDATGQTIHDAIIAADALLCPNTTDRLPTLSLDPSATS